MYPRLTDDNKLITVDGLVGYTEHLERKHRILIYGTERLFELDYDNALWAWDSIGHDPIKIVIHSPGGVMDTAFQLYDTIKTLKSPVWTIGMYCASAAVMILAAGTKRYLTPHARVMLHLPSGRLAGDAADLTIQHARIQKYKEEMVSVLRDCGVRKSREQILGDIDREFWLSAQEAIDYGLADEILTAKVVQEKILVSQNNQKEVVVWRSEKE